MPDVFSKINYDGNYWDAEYTEAFRRENEDCCMRALELIYLSKIQIERILDFGCGLGITVCWLRDKFGIDAYGIDKYGRFDPTSYLLKEDILTTNIFLENSFDAIMSVEVVEHLGQDLIIPIFERLRDILKPGGMILINTGTLEFTRESPDNKKYIDPSVRGHISIFSHRTFRKLADTIGLIYIPMWNRTWCALLFKPKEGIKPTISPWESLEKNVTVLRSMGVVPLLVRQSLWAEQLAYELRFQKKIPNVIKKVLNRLLRN
jgi:SAM-dependent methyltransferase